MAEKLEDGWLENDLHELVSSWIAHKDVIPECWKGGVNPINAMAYCDLQNSGITGCSDFACRARKNRLRLKSLSDTLSNISSAIQAESEAARANYEAVSNMCSLIFLPDELLARIFQFVVNGDRGLANSTRSKVAVTLSHVNQHFRKTALSCASLWSNITGSSDMALLCLSRSKQLPLDVALTVDFTAGDVPGSHELAFEQSLIDTLPHSKRWRSLVIQFVTKSRRNRMPNGIPKIRQAFCGIDFRSLESLHFRNNKDWKYMFKNYSEFQHWDTPNLRHLTSVYYFPLSLPGLTNLTSLNITLNLGQISLVAFHKDLSRMKALEDFKLKFVCGGSETDSAQLFEKAELPNVQRLCIESGVHASQSNALMKSFFSSVFFPGAVDLHVGLSGSLHSTIFDDVASLYVGSEVKNIMQHPGLEQFPRVERFCLEANAVNIGTLNTGRGQEMKQGSISLVHLNMLPGLQHLTLCSNGLLGIGSDASASGASLPTLETITIQIIKPAALDVACFVSHILKKQIERGEWEIFRELVVMENNQENDERANKATKAYARDAALEWCKRRMSEVSWLKTQKQTVSKLID